MKPEVERFKAETYYAILNGINKALKERGDAEITFEELFPRIRENLKSTRTPQRKPGPIA